MSTSGLRDPVSGLPVVPLSFLSTALQDTLVRNQQGVVPLVLFAEWAYKVSEGSKNRFTKERLIIVTPDSLNVFAADGAIKRRVKISDVHAFYQSEGFVPEAGGGADSARTTTGVSMPAGTEISSGVSLARRAGTSRLPRITVALEIPRQFDCAFDFVRESPARSQSAVNHLRRTLVILYRLARSSVGGPTVDLRVCALPSRDIGPHQGSSLEYFRLKKRLAAGAHPHGRKGPLLAPVLPLVTRDMEQAAANDPQYHVELALAEIDAQIRQYTEDLRQTSTSESTQQRIEAFSKRFNNLHASLAQTERREADLRQRMASGSEAADSMASALRGVRQEYLEKMAALNDIRSKHDDAVKAIRHEMDLVDGRIAELQQREVAVGESTRHQLRALDETIRLEESAVNQLEAELRWKYEALPSLENLHEECCLLETSVAQLQEVRQAEAAERVRLDDMQRLQAQLLEENRTLELQAGEALETARLAKAETVRLTGSVSMVLARRNKLVKQLEAMRGRVAQCKADVEALQAAVHVVQVREGQSAHRAAVDTLEAIAAEDFQREVSLRREIMHSEREAAAHASDAELRLQKSLQAKLDRMRKARLLSSQR